MGGLNCAMERAPSWRRRCHGAWARVRFVLSFGFECEFLFTLRAQCREWTQRRRPFGLLRFGLCAPEPPAFCGRRRLLGLGLNFRLDVREPAFSWRRRRLIGFWFGLRLSFRGDREDDGLFFWSRRGPLWFLQWLEV